MAGGDVKRTFDSTTDLDRSVVQDFETVGAKEFPELKFIGGGTEEEPTLSNLSEPCDEMKYEWFYDQDRPLVTATIASIANDSDTTINVTATDGTYIGEGVVLQCGDERMLVTTKGTSAGAVVVTRGYDGTTAAAHTTVGTAVYVVGVTHKEDGAAPKNTVRNPTNNYNYCHPFIAGFSVSDIETSVKRYGVADIVEKRTQQELRFLYQMMTSQYLTGVRTLGTDTTAYRAGGFSAFVDSTLNVAAAGSSFNFEQHVYPHLRAQAAWGTDKISDTIFCGAWMREKIAAEALKAGIVYNRNAVEGVVGMKVDQVITNWGELQLIYSPWVNQWKPGSIYLEKAGWTKIGPLAGSELKRTELARTGPQRTFQIYGVYTFEFRGVYSRAITSGLSTTV